MVHKCCVKRCTSVWSPESSIMFHGFPTNIVQRCHWLAVLKLKENYHSSAKICSLHFKSTDYDHTGKRLKHTAKPFYNSLETVAVDNMDTLDSLHSESETSNSSTSSNVDSIPNIQIPLTCGMKKPSELEHITVSKNNTTLRQTVQYVNVKIPQPRSLIKTLDHKNMIAPKNNTYFIQIVEDINAKNSLSPTTKKHSEDEIKIVPECNRRFIQLFKGVNIPQIRSKTTFLDDRNKATFKSNTRVIQIVEDANHGNHKILPSRGVTKILDDENKITPKSNTRLIQIVEDENVKSPVCSDKRETLDDECKSASRNNTHLIQMLEDTNGKVPRCSYDENGTVPQKKSLFMQDVEGKDEVADGNSQWIKKSDASIQAKLVTPREQVLRKRIKILTQKIMRQNKYMLSMKSLIESIRQYSRQPEIENIVTGAFATLSKKLNKNNKKTKSPHGLRFTEEVKNFALTLYLHSPKAYNFLRMYMTLPHPETLRRSDWYKNKSENGLTSPPSM